MLSKSQISFVKSLHNKKSRKEHGLFLVEGIKSVTEFIHSDYIVDTIFYTEGVLPKLGKLSHKIKLQQISETDLSKISALTTSQNVLALVQLPQINQIEVQKLQGTFTLALDGIQDPGNLGTIIRTADWFGFKHIICSTDSVEAYNPKVVQATMGSLSRMNIIYTNLSQFLNECQLPVFGAQLNGKSIYQTDFGKEGIIVLGNEGNGISDEVNRQIQQAVTIPAWGRAESLNVAVSAAIFCSEVKRNI
ncbi:MAG TPA: RNA methyltransferase [Daejeonella sp.]|nr:RNA methyltransferase [Daejeonella sp.]